MKIFVSGATGFIGGHLARSLISEGHQVRTLARATVAAEPLRKLGVDVVSGDLVDYDAVRRAVAGCDLVYHLAAVQPNSDLDKDVFDEVNVKGTAFVARAASEAGARHLVHCSTVAVYGKALRLPVDERAPTRPDSVYGASKLRGEEVAVEQCRLGGIPATVARLTRVYGPGDLTFLRIFKDVLAGTFIMIGSGNNLYHLTYIDDVVAGLKACAAGPKESGGCYIIGSGEVGTLRQIVETIAEEGGVAPPRWRVPALPFVVAGAVNRLLLQPLGREPNIVHKLTLFTTRQAYDISKARLELMFRSAVSLREGVRRTIAWYRNQGLVSIAGALIFYADLAG